MPLRRVAFSGALNRSLVIARTSQFAPRSFTTTSVLCKSPLARRKGGDLGSHLPKYVIPSDVKIPAYPYGASRLYKQQDKGLYGRKTIQFGNNVSDKTETKTRRSWKPNVLSKSLYSVALKKKIKLRVTSSVLKTMDREGGLDEYLLKQSDNRIKELGPLGWALRWTLLQKPSVVQRMRDEAVALGVPQEKIDAQWPLPAAAEEGESVADSPASDAALEEYVKAEQAMYRNRTKFLEQAVDDYSKIMFVGERYRKRGMVDTLEQGVKFGLLTEKARAEKRAQNLAAFRARLEEKLGREFKNEKEFKKAAGQHRLDVKKDIAAAGSYEAYRDQMRPEATAEWEAKVAAAGGKEAMAAKRKEDRLNEIRAAEQALTDENTPEEERLRVQTALEKAEMTLNAASAEDYATQAYTKWQEEHADEWPLNTALSQEGLGEAWEEAPEVPEQVEKTR